MERWRSRSRRATIVLLVTSAVLIGPALSGAGATVPLAGLLVALAAGLFAVRDSLGELPMVIGYDLGEYARDGWIGPLLGAGVVLGTLGSPAVELQAYGGLLGLLGMVNYFFRPLYLTIISSLRRETNSPN